MLTIGFETVCKTNDYNKALGSARLRCYDLINYFKEDKDFETILYTPNKQYDVVVFQKMFDKNTAKRAQELRAKGTKTIFDIGTNYLDLDPECVSQAQKDLCINMLSNVDFVSVSSPYLKTVYSRLHENVHFINDAVEDRFLSFNKQYEQKEETTLVYCGYSNKAKELNLIKDVLVELHSSNPIKVRYVTDKDPGNLLGVPYEFVQFDYANLPKQLLGGDIKVSPRNLDRVYNMGHSVVKIAYPMSLGMPVVVSPIPSYVQYVQDKFICHNQDEWFNALETLICNPAERFRIGKENKDIVSNELCLNKVGVQWKAFFSEVVK